MSDAHILVRRPTDRSPQLGRWLRRHRLLQRRRGLRRFVRRLGGLRVRRPGLRPDLRSGRLRRPVRAGGGPFHAWVRTVSPRPRTGFRPAERSPLDPTSQETGTVKWYNTTKGFGFIVRDGGGKDVFVHASALERSGVASLFEGQRVVLKVVEGRKGPEAATVAVTAFE